MTEKYLHYIWSKKRIPKTDVISTDGEHLSILDFGTYNENLQGPDFKMASIRVGNITLFGHVEIHVNSADWYRHKHEKDSNYDNVILHVVSNHDKDIYQNNRKIPTIELELDPVHYRNFCLKKYKQVDFPCSSILTGMDTFHFEFMKQRALTDKLNSKISELRSAGLYDSSGAFYHLVGLAFGSGVNKEQFKSILLQLPYSELNLVPKSKRYNLVMTMSGVMQKVSREKSGLAF